MYAFPDKLNTRGMTLIEVMFALVLLLLTSLAMIKTGLLAIQTNMVNSLRDEAVSVAETRMNELKNEQFISSATSTWLNTTGASGAYDSTVYRKIRAASSVPFKRTRIVEPINTTPPAKQVSVIVEWTYRGQPYTHSVTSIVRQQEVPL